MSIADFKTELFDFIGQLGILSGSTLLTYLPVFVGHSVSRVRTFLYQFFNGHGVKFKSSLW